MMNVSGFYVQYNTMTLSSIASFSDIVGRLAGGSKDVYFLRGLGCSTNYLADIEAMDTSLHEKELQGQLAYLRLAALPLLQEAEQVSALRAQHDQWKAGTHAFPKLAICANNAPLGTALAAALDAVCALFLQHSPHATPSIEANFTIKLLHWLEEAAAPLLRQWTAHTLAKFVYTGPVKKAEYLFCYLLTLLGIDVLLLSPTGAIPLEETLLALSDAMQLGEADTVRIPPFSAKDTVKAEPEARACVAVPPKRPIPAITTSRADRAPLQLAPLSTAPATEQAELAFEQLALLAASVVMIEVLDEKGEVLSGGSGIMLGAEGYLLTNHHVACRGTHYAIHIEGDKTVYHTSELIKTHGLLDLALIRVDRKLQPIPLYRGSAPLLRGQRVVAIGSPLGLFNSVSDGIISGFRTIDDVDMIQFTAPTSPGSSGGALLNMYGEVIGISTAGMDRGQNLNLAVGYQSILPFVGGFIK